MELKKFLCIRPAERYTRSKRARARNKPVSLEWILDEKKNAI